MIKVLRLGHRLGRDARISTHVGLVSRAFGADSIVYSGQKDEKMMDSVRKVAKEFGGEFDVSYDKSWRRVVESFEGIKVHLTMYGEPVEDKIGEIKGKDVLVIVGGEKVPGEIYSMSDFNLSITSQPHSEVAALGVFLDRLDLKDNFGHKSINKQSLRK